MLFNVEVPFYFFLQTDFVSFIIYLVRGRQGLLSDVISQQQCNIFAYLFVYLDMKMLCLHAKSYLKSLDPIKMCSTDIECVVQIASV